MTISLFDISIPSYLQALNAINPLLEKGLLHFQVSGRDEESILDLSLHDTMQPLRFQLISVMHHSLGAIEGIMRGEFNPPPAKPDKTVADFQAAIKQTIARLSAFTPDDINALAGKPVVFRAGSLELPFSAETFVLSFSLPNLYFHAATAYDLLRKDGVELSKKDYLGKLRFNRS